MIRWGALAIATTVAATALVSSAGAAPQSAGSATANLSTRAAASTYLRSLGINPRGFVIQRGRAQLRGAELPRQGLDMHDLETGAPGRPAGRPGERCLLRAVGHRRRTRRGLRDRAGHARRRQHRHLHAVQQRPEREPGLRPLPDELKRHEHRQRGPADQHRQRRRLQRIAKPDAGDRHQAGQQFRRERRAHHPPEGERFGSTSAARRSKMRASPCR